MKEKKISPFKQKVLQIVEMIPHGRVASYGQVAHLAGVPRGARQVGWILNGTEGHTDIDFPWWRVVNNKGRVSIKGTKYNTADLQRKLLRSEDVEVN
ncbi:MAG: MGMT family protein, partial [Candidatus Roizmanbacteria bacterium]